jgi:hypothetical protein
MERKKPPDVSSGGFVRLDLSKPYICGFWI